MIRGCFPLAVLLAVASGMTSVQGASDRTVETHACPSMAGSERSQCLDNASRGAAAGRRLALAGDGWVVSETTSPVDYSPIATATTTSRTAAGGEPMHLAIRCRSGRTELAVTGSAITGHGDDYFISYRVNGGPAVQLPGAAPAFGDGVAFKGDVVGLLQSLPNDGNLAVLLLPLTGRGLSGEFALSGLEALRAKIGTTCKWPHAVAKPNDR
jgi:hypothetical protein